MSQLKTAAGYDLPDVQFKNIVSPLLFSCSFPVILGPSLGKSTVNRIVFIILGTIKRQHKQVFIVSVTPEEVVFRYT